ncbi:Gfo/Idh/MocA family oxidoreductase [uncultured Bacteroides sp.]|uniref:Gfo/Idh/MocA family protein n=1 Tax=uncultured Bacteroides sp. TaxID=162156 RepID=UPI002AA8952D|nr:Gfo/Idh/MocA family oxidoreductase [uncultured Bacteroides sp.]
MEKRICVIGGGRWGKNHIKTLSGMGCLAAIVESNAERLNNFLTQYPSAKGFTDIDEAIAERYDGYTVAVPAELHFDIGEKLLKKGLNVLMEKPMTMTAQESEQLVKIAKDNNARLMVGHVLLFHPAIRKIKELIGCKKIGKLYYIYSNRLNLGTVRTEESVFASFAPHDISVLDYLTDSHATQIEAKGECFLQKNVCDCTVTQLEYPDNVHGHIFVSWLHPFKQQLLVVVGSEGMISFDDATTEKEIHFYNKKIEFQNGIPAKVEQPDEIIAYEKKMPLEEELHYFVSHTDSEIEINSGKAGLEVVRILEQVQKLINK